MKFKSLDGNKVSFIKDDSHGWIQFKGTDLCMDVRCKCGHVSHIDGQFIYVLECCVCGAKYELNGFIQLIERDESEIDVEIHKSF